MSEGAAAEPPENLTPEKLLATRVESTREGLGMSQSELARRMSSAGFTWSQSTVYKVESEGRKLTFLEGLALARILLVKPEQLVDMRKVMSDYNRQMGRLFEASVKLDDIDETMPAVQAWLDEHWDELYPAEREALASELKCMRERLGRGDATQ